MNKAQGEQIRQELKERNQAMQFNNNGIDIDFEENNESKLPIPQYINSRSDNHKNGNVEDDMEFDLGGGTGGEITKK